MRLTDEQLEDGRELDALAAERERTLPAMEDAYRKGGPFLLHVAARMIRDHADAIAALRPYKALHESTLKAQMTHMRDAKQQRERAERAEADARQLRSYLSECARAVGARVDPSAMGGMKLTDEQRAALTNALRAFAATGDGDGCDEIAFLAGCAWQRERDAKLCDEHRDAEDKWAKQVNGHNYRANMARELAAAIRAQGGDRG